MRRATRGRRPAQPEHRRREDDLDVRLARIENALEALAIEIERIGEGQRFLTRLLAQSAIPPAGQPLEPK